MTWQEVTGNSTYGWNAAGGSITSATAGFSSGPASNDTIYLASNHAESFTTQPQVLPASTTLTYVSVDESAAPPTTLKTGASITITGGIWGPTSSSNTNQLFNFNGLTIRKSGKGF